MPFRPFHDLLPEMAERETRGIIIPPGAEQGLPPGNYAFVELFCDEPGCDCRRAFLMVVASFAKEPQAVIAWGWETPSFYRKWYPRGSARDIRDLQGPILNDLSPATPMSQPLLDLFRTVILKDPAFVARVQRHYRLFREKIEENQERSAGRRGKRKLPTATST